MNRAPSRWRLLPSDLAPLGSPLWWLALAVLLVNDHFLKGRRIVPGWLTGKLSDFAFLVVAPVVLAALLPARLRGRRPLAVLAVVGVYLAADLSPAFSAWLVALATRFGMAWKLWPDPTDLIALAILPVTLHLLYASPQRVADLRRLPRTGSDANLARRLRERAGVLLGAAACLATSAPPTTRGAPFLLNATSAAETVKVTWVLRRLDSTFPCPAPATLTDTLIPGDLDDPRTMTLTSGQVAALDGPPPAGVSPVGTCVASGWNGSPMGECVAAIFEVPGLDPVLMVTRERWTGFSESGGCSSSPPAPLCQPTLNPASDPGPDALSIREVNGARRFVAGASVQIAPVDPAAIAARVPAAGGCRGLRDSYHDLLAKAACTTNADCTGQQGLHLPGDPGACGIHVGTGQAADLADLDRRWRESCLTEYPSCDRYPQPAVCRNGTCAAACPGVEVPPCPAPCGDRSVGGGRPSCLGIPIQCKQSDGRICSCEDGADTCHAAEPAAPGCMLSCVDYPGGGFLGAPPTDGGVATDGAANADGATGDASID